MKFPGWCLTIFSCVIQNFIFVPAAEGYSGQGHTETTLIDFSRCTFSVVTLDFFDGVFQCREENRQILPNPPWASGQVNNQ